MSLSDRLVAEQRAHEQERPYQIDRADVRSEAQGAEWLREYRDASGDRVWLTAGDRTRERMARRLFWLRWLHRKDWLARGGVDER